RNHPAHHFASRNILCNGRSASYRNSIPDRNVMGCSHLSRDYASAAYARASGEAGHRSDYRVFSDLTVVTDMHEIIELDASPQNCFAETAGIDRAIGPDLTVIFNKHASELKQL